MPGIPPRTVYTFCLPDLTRAPWGGFTSTASASHMGGNWGWRRCIITQRHSWLMVYLGLPRPKAGSLAALLILGGLCIEYLKWCFVHLMGHDKPPQNSVTESNHLLPSSTWGLGHCRWTLDIISESIPLPLEDLATAVKSSGGQDIISESVLWPEWTPGQVQDTASFPLQKIYLAGC